MWWKMFSEMDPWSYFINTLQPWKKPWYFEENILKDVFLKQNDFILFEIS